MLNLYGSLNRGLEGPTRNIEPVGQGSQPASSVGILFVKRSVCVLACVRACVHLYVCM